MGSGPGSRSRLGATSPPHPTARRARDPPAEPAASAGTGEIAVGSVTYPSPFLPLTSARPPPHLPGAGAPAPAEGSSSSTLPVILPGAGGKR